MCVCVFLMCKINKSGKTIHIELRINVIRSVFFFLLRENKAIFGSNNKTVLRNRLEQRYGSNTLRRRLASPTHAWTCHKSFHCVDRCNRCDWFVVFKKVDCLLCRYRYWFVDRMLSYCDDNMIRG